MTVLNKVEWAIEPDRCALLIHDMQPHYLHILPNDCRRRLIENVRSIAMDCIASGIPIFASLVPPQDERERGLMLDMWGKGPAISQGLEPELGLERLPVRALVKRSYSAFYGNDFDLLLRRLDRDAIIIVGVYTSIGCHYSAVDAFARDIRPFLVSDALADLDPADHIRGLETASRICARVVDTNGVCAALAPGASVRLTRRKVADPVDPNA